MKMRLCARCGLSLIEIKQSVYQCPKHGVRHGTIKSMPLQRDRLAGLAYEAGAIEYAGSKKSGKKRKKPIKRDIAINIFDRP